MRDYSAYQGGAYRVTVKDRVATITRQRGEGGGGRARLNAPNLELASAFAELREDSDVRVIVLTGTGDTFAIPPLKEFYEREVHGSVGDSVRSIAIARVHEIMAEIEKPIIGKVNGDAVGFGQSLVFSCDIIVAREDARFMDHHMGGLIADREGKEHGHEVAIVPGDGGAALVPLYMSPCRAMEYLMLARSYTAAELERLGVINYAVPAHELDAKVDDMVRRLLQRNPYSLAWTKRLVKQRVRQHLALTLDASTAYERVNWLQIERLKGEGEEMF